MEVAEPGKVGGMDVEASPAPPALVPMPDSTAPPTLVPVVVKAPAPRKRKQPPSTPEILDLTQPSSISPGGGRRQSKSVNRLQPTFASDNAEKLSANRAQKAAQKKGVKELEQEVREQEDRCKAAEERKAAADKRLERMWPVKDEDIVKFAGNKKEARPTPLPVPEMRLGLPRGESEASSGDLLFCWDFLNTYGKQLEMAPIEVEDLAALMTFTGRTSVALVEVFCAPLRALFAERRLRRRINRKISPKFNFAHKKTMAEIEIEKAAVASFSSFSSFSSQSSASLALTVPPLPGLPPDTSNPTRLVPPTLRPELLDPLRFQNVLAACLLLLPLVRRLDAAERDAVAVLAPPVLPPSPSTLAGSQRHQQVVKKGQEKLASSPGTVNAAIHQRLQQLVAGKRRNGLNLDAILGVSASCDDSFLPLLHEASALLHTTELHALSCRHKLTVLRALCLSCFETKRFRELIDGNSREMMRRIQQHKQERYEAAAEKRAAGKELTEKADKLCRKENAAAAAEKAEKEAAKEARKAAKDAKDKKDGKQEAVEKPKGKGKGKAAEDKEPQGKGKGKAAAKKDDLAPTSTQLLLKLEYLQLLRDIGVDEVVLTKDMDADDSETESENGDDDAPTSARQVQARREKMRLDRSRLKDSVEGCHEVRPAPTSFSFSFSFPFSLSLLP